MNRILQTLNRRLALLGVPGIVGLGVIIACLGFYVTVISPMQYQLQQRQQLLNEQRVSVKVSHKADWRTLQNYLPPLAQADEISANIYRLAKAAQIDLRNAEYKEENLGKTGMVARHLNIAVSGDYFHLRRFLSSALNETPEMALDAVSFQKSGAADGLLDMKITLTLYLSRQIK